MNLNSLIEAIMNEDEGGMVGPAVAQDGNTSIAYLPGGFSSMKNSLRSLSTVKKQWKIDVLEDANNCTVRFENALNVIMPLTAYDEFNTKVINVRDNKEVDLQGLINESIQEATEAEVKRLVANVGSKLMTLRNNKSMALASHSMGEWLHTFKSSKIDPVINAPINLLDFNRSIQTLATKAGEVYKDDVGGLEMLVKSLVSGVGLSGQELFNNKDTFAEGKIQSRFGSINMTLHTKVSMEMILEQHIEVDDDRLADDVAALRSVKVSGNKIYPTQSVFQAGFFNTLKKLADDIEDMR